MPGTKTPRPPDSRPRNDRSALCTSHCPPTFDLTMTHTSGLDTDVTLRDGRVVHVRTVRPADEEEILQAFGRMSEDARYMRFMCAINALNVERLRKALSSFPESGAGIVATVPAADGQDIVASAIYFVGPDPGTCEFAITVGSEFGGVGLARSLMRTLIDLARQRGLKTMQGFVLAANPRMLSLATRLGFSVAPDPEDRAVRICSLDLASVSESLRPSDKATIDLHNNRFDHEHNHHHHNQRHDSMERTAETKRSPKARASASRMTNLDPNSTTQAMKKRMNLLKPPGRALKNAATLCSMTIVIFSRI